MGVGEEEPALTGTVGPCLCRGFKLSAGPLGAGRMKPAQSMLDRQEGK